MPQKSFFSVLLGGVLLGGAIVSLSGCSVPENPAAVVPANSSDRTDSFVVSSPVVPAPSQNATAPAAEFLIVPGERVGQITAATTFNDLVSLYGAEQLTNQQVSVGEGFLAPSTRVNLGETRSFTVIWTDDSQTRVEAVTDLGTDWKTIEGIGKDSTLADLQNILGPFQFYGFGWDYSGTIVLTGTQLDSYGTSLILRLAPQPGTVESRSADFQALMGDRLFNSDSPHLQPLYPFVDEIIVRLSKTR